MKDKIKISLLLFLIILQLGMEFSFKKKMKNRFDVLKEKINKALKGKKGIKFIYINNKDFLEMKN